MNAKWRARPHFAGRKRVGWVHLVPMLIKPAEQPDQ